MSSNLLRALVITVGILSILLCALLFTVYLVRQRSSSKTTSPPNQSFCPRPNVYSSNYDFDYVKHGHESQNLHGKIDYFRLSLSWSPSFCLTQTAKKHFQCEHSFGLIVHGLWPSSRNGSHPRNCRNEPPISIDLIQRYFCLMPSENLMQAEWEKHGTCFWNRAEDYFHQIEELHSKIHLPSNLPEILNESNLTKRMRHGRIKNQFLQLNPDIPPRSMDIILKGGGKLKEIAFCYDHQFHYTPCH